MNVERFSAYFDPSYNSEKGIVQGRALVFGDSARGWQITSAGPMPAEMPSVYSPGSFKKTIKEISASGDPIPLTFEHTVEPVGPIFFLDEQSNRFLFMKARFSDTSRAKDVYTLVKDKLIRGLSIESAAVKWDIRRDDMGNPYRLVKEAKLSAVSLVRDPAFADARVTDINSKVCDKSIDVYSNHLLCVLPANHAGSCAYHLDNFKVESESLDNHNDRQSPTSQRLTEMRLKQHELKRIG